MACFQERDILLVFLFKFDSSSSSLMKILLPGDWNLRLFLSQCLDSVLYSSFYLLIIFCFVVCLLVQFYLCSRLCFCDKPLLVNLLFIIFVVLHKLGFSFLCYTRFNSSPNIYPVSRFQEILFFRLFDGKLPPFWKIYIHWGES